MDIKTRMLNKDKRGIRDKLLAGLKGAIPKLLVEIVPDFAAVKELVIKHKKRSQTSSKKSRWSDEVDAIDEVDGEVGEVGEVGDGEDKCMFHVKIY